MIVTANITGDTDDLGIVAGALAESADRRRRTAITAAGELEKDRKADPNSPGITAAALGIVRVLAEADLLTTWATTLGAAIAQPGTPAQAPAALTSSAPQQPPPPLTPAEQAIITAEAAVAAARARVPTITELAATYNAALGAATIDGAPAWVAPGVLDDDDPELAAEDLLALDLQP